MSSMGFGKTFLFVAIFEMGIYYESSPRRSQSGQSWPGVRVGFFSAFFWATYCLPHYLEYPPHSSKTDGDRLKLMLGAYPPWVKATFHNFPTLKAARSKRNWPRYV